MVVEAQAQNGGAPELPSAGKKGGKGTGNRRVRNRRRGGGDADHSLDESNPENQVSVSESSTGSDSSDRSDTPRRVPEGKELMSKTLIIQNKRFYVDVRETASGKYVKLAEVLPGGRKSRLSLTLRVTRELRNHLTKFSEFYASLGPAPITSDGATSSAASSPLPGGEKAAQSESDAPASPKSEGANRVPPLKSAVIYVGSGKSSGKRRYYLDLKENRRGRFLQVSEAAQKDGFTQRYRVAIPAQGLVEMRDTLSGILREFMPSSEESASNDVGAKGGDSKGSPIKVQDVKTGKEDGELPIAKSMKIHPGKVIYFDPGTNPRGNFVKISQVTTRFRTSILLPTEALTQVGQILKDLQKGFNKGAKETKVNASKAKRRVPKPRVKRAPDSKSPPTVMAAA